MLASKYRLKSRSSFVRVEIDGKLIQSKSFGLGIYDRKDKEPSHFGFIISTKISKRAVIRNKIKRIMADRIRLNLDKISDGYDCVFLAKPIILKTTKENLEKEVYETLTQNL